LDEINRADEERQAKKCRIDVHEKVEQRERRKEICSRKIGSNQVKE